MIQGAIIAGEHFLEPHGPAGVPVHFTLQRVIRSGPNNVVELLDAAGNLVQFPEYQFRKQCVRED